MPPNASIEQIHAFVAPHGPDAFAKWRTATDALNQLGDKLEMFDRFATIEDESEPLEKMIDDTVADFDREIQHEIDVARGKQSHRSSRIGSRPLPLPAHVPAMTMVASFVSSF